MALSTPGGKVCLVTDGGSTGLSGYYGWLIANEQEALHGGTCRLDSDSSQLQSLRPESVAYIACTTFLLDYTSRHNTKIESLLQHHVENMTLVRRMMAYNHQEPPSQVCVLKPDFYVQLQINDNMDKLHKTYYTNIQTHHVKAYQDTRKKGPLIWEETLNVMADDIAGESMGNKKPPQQQLPAQDIAMWSGNYEVTANHKQFLKMRWIERGTHSLQQYLNNKCNWTHQYGDIDWKCIPSNKMGTGRRTFITSYSHQWLPLQKSLHNRKNIGTPLFPMCSTDNETHLHFITCNHYPGNGIEKAITQITSVMTKEEVEPLLQHMAVRGIRSALEGQKQIGVEGIPTSYSPLIRQQQEIGWSHLLYTRWKNIWHDWQHQHGKNNNIIIMDVRAWTKKVIEILWEHAYQ